MTKTFSSVKEALSSGILDRHTLRRPNRNQPTEGQQQQQPLKSCLRNSFNRRPSDETSSTAPTAASVGSSATGSSTRGMTLSQSFTVGLQPRQHRADTRHNSSFTPISEETFSIERIPLNSSPPPPQEIDLSEMNSDDLQRLKSEDPFMYYSIPEVHKRSYRFGEVSANDIAAAVLGEEDLEEDYEEEEEMDEPQELAPQAVGRRPRHRPAMRHASCPAGMLANADIARAMFELNDTHSASSVVSKRRRLSVEAHPALVCDYLMLDEDGLEGSGRSGLSDSVLDEEEHFLAALMNATVEDCDESV